jgi:hypothetical protein
MRKTASQRLAEMRAALGGTIEGFQPVPRARLVALLISRLDLAARRRPRRIHPARDLPADLALQRTAARHGSVGTDHGCEVLIELLDARVGQPRLRRLRPVEGDPKVRAACPALLTDIHRQTVFPLRIAAAGRGCCHLPQVAPVRASTDPSRSVEQIPMLSMPRTIRHLRARPGAEFDTLIGRRGNRRFVRGACEPAAAARCHSTFGGALREPELGHGPGSIS